MYIKTPRDIGQFDSQPEQQPPGTQAEERQNGSGRWRPQVVKEERFLRLHAEEIIGRVKTPDAKTAARNAARFYEVAPPGPGASLKELSACRERAVKAGLPVTAQDIEDYQVALEDATQGASLMSCQEAFVLGAEDFFEPTPGTKILAQAVLRHNPKLVEQIKLTNLQVRDNQENANHNLTKDLDPERVLYENPERFRSDMNALARMGPLPNKPKADEIRIYREQLRKVGVRLTLDDVKTYQKALAEHGTRGLLRPGATDGMPLSSAMLVDLHRKPAARELVGADAERFAHVLQRRPAMRPAPPEPAVERGRDVRPLSGVYGIPLRVSQATQGPTMVRDGKQQTIPNGYQQSGRLFMVSNGEVFQRIDKQTCVRYPEADVRAALGGAERLKEAITYGHEVRIRVQQGRMTATNLGLERAQQRSSPALRDRV